MKNKPEIETLLEYRYEELYTSLKILSKSDIKKYIDNILKLFPDLNNNIEFNINNKNLTEEYKKIVIIILEFKYIFELENSIKLDKIIKNLLLGIEREEILKSISLELYKLWTYYEKFLNNQKLKNLYINSQLIHYELKNKNLIFNKNFVEPIWDKERKTREDIHITIELNKACNFKCKYCYEGLDKETMVLDYNKIPEFVNNLKKIQEQLQKEKEIEIYFNFSILGGEPTLVPPKVSHLLTELLNKELNLDHITLITNTFNYERVVNFFHPEFPKEKIQIQVSYDGLGIHNEYRLGISKPEDTQNIVRNNAIKLIENGYIVGFKPTLPIPAFLNTELVKKAILDYKDLIDNVKNNANYYLTFDESSDISISEIQKIKGKYDFISERIYNLFEWLLPLELEHLYTNKIPITRWFFKYSFTANDIECSAQHGEYIGITPTGDLNFCHRADYYINESKYQKRFKDIHKMHYGNLFNNFNEKKVLQNMKEIKNINDSIQNTECENCDTLFCVKCPVVNLMNQDLLQSGKNELKYVFNSSQEETHCFIHNEISNYLFIYHIIKIFKGE